MMLKRSVKHPNYHIMKIHEIPQLLYTISGNVFSTDFTNRHRLFLPLFQKTTEQIDTPAHCNV